MLNRPWNVHIFLKNHICLRFFSAYLIVEADTKMTELQNSQQRTGVRYQSFSRQFVQSSEVDYTPSRWTVRSDWSQPYVQQLDTQLCVFDVDGQINNSL